MTTEEMRERVIEILGTGPAGILEISEVLEIPMQKMRTILQDGNEFTQDSDTFLWSLAGKKAKGEKKAPAKQPAQEKKEVEVKVEKETKSKEKESNMKESKERKEETIEIIQTAIENLKSGKKEFTLKGMKASLAKQGITLGQKLRTKKEYIAILEECTSTLQDAREKVAKEKVQESQETKADNSVIPTVPVHGTIQTIIDNLKGGNKEHTLKAAKQALMNVCAHRDTAVSESEKECITSATNARTKADFIIAAEPLTNHEEREVQEETQEVKEVEEKEKEQTLSNSLAAVEILMEKMSKTHAVAIKDHVTPLVNEIKALKDVIKNQAAEIKVLQNNIKNLDLVGPHCPVSVVMEGSVSDKMIKQVKSAAEIKAEKRLAFIKELKGLEKELFKCIEKKKGNVQSIMDLVFSHDQNTPKEIKSSLVKLVKAGLIEKIRSGKEAGFKLAKVQAYIDKKKPLNKGKETGEKAPAAKAPRTGKRSISAIVIDALEDGPKSVNKLVKVVLRELPEKEKNTLKKTIRGLVGYNLIKRGIEVKKHKEDGKRVRYSI